MGSGKHVAKEETEVRKWMGKQISGMGLGAAIKNHGKSCINNQSGREFEKDNFIES